jgi:hypothetical protein
MKPSALLTALPILRYLCLPALTLGSLPLLPTATHAQEGKTSFPIVAHSVVKLLEEIGRAHV